MDSAGLAGLGESRGSSPTAATSSHQAGTGIQSAGRSYFSQDHHSSGDLLRMGGGAVHHTEARHTMRDPEGQRDSGGTSQQDINPLSARNICP